MVPVVFIIHKKIGHLSPEYRICCLLGAIHTIGGSSLNKAWIIDFMYLLLTH